MNKNAVELVQYLENPNVQAFLGLLRDTEGTAKGEDPYRVYGGSAKNQIKDLSKPDFKKWGFTQTDGKKNSSTASGAYQFLERTWGNLAKEYGLKDFSPRSQDLGAIALLKQNGALKHILDGDFGKAVQKSNKTWASLPGSPYAQHTRDMNYVNASLQKHLGQPIDLSQYEGGNENPKQKAPTQSTSRGTTSVQKDQVNSLVNNEKTNLTINQASKTQGIVTTAIQKVLHLFRKP